MRAIISSLLVLALTPSVAQEPDTMPCQVEYDFWNQVRMAPWKYSDAEYERHVNEILICLIREIRELQTQ